MKFAFHTTLFLVSVTPALAFTKVHIDVKCQGAQHNNWDVNGATIVANALETSFNEIHSATDSNDSELTDVHYYAGADGAFPHQGGGYGGYYDCRLCPDDDSSYLSLGDVTGVKLTAWESALVSTLVSSSHPDFQSITSCAIQMTPTASAAATVEKGPLNLVVADENDSLAVGTPVTMEINCKGVTFSKLSIADDTFAGHVLEDSYNTVHGECDNDDSELSNVVYEHTLFVGSGGADDDDDDDEYHLQRWGRRSWYGGNYDCRLCPDDDAAMMLGSGGAAHSGWEEEFAKGLVESGRRAFKKVTKCSIKMSAKNLAASRGGGGAAGQVRTPCVCPRVSLFGRSVGRSFTTTAESPIHIYI